MSRQKLPKLWIGVLVGVLFYWCILTLPAAYASSSSKFTFPATDHKSRRKLARIHKNLTRINKPASKTIQSADGDLIDCVKTTQQPAFDHPLLKNHTLETPPPIPFQSGAKNHSSTGIHPQQWYQGDGCPDGTVPIRRTLYKDVVRAGSVSQYRKKKNGMSSVPKPGSPTAMNNSGHEHAIGYMQGGSYYGAQATMNVWSPSIQVPSEFSLSQIWILAGSFNSDLNSIEAGWQVSPQLYGDNNPRFFTYWTTDAYQSTGCYNLLCSGFVQTSNSIAIGATITPVSTQSGSQYDISILIWKDPSKGNWWMEFGGSYIVGYWPASLFTHLDVSATMLEWGGEVVNSEPGGSHTATAMGSGQFAEAGFSRASYVRNIKYVDSTNNLKTPAGMQTLAEHPTCYDIQSSSNNDWGTYFYYGGPGKNANCP